MHYGLLEIGFFKSFLCHFLNGLKGERVLPATHLFPNASENAPHLVTDSPFGSGPSHPLARPV